jgi:hypothetical protein
MKAISASRTALHRVSCGSVDREIVDHCADQDTAPHELTDCVAYVFIIAAQAIDPPNHKHVAGPQLVEQAMTLGAQPDLTHQIAGRRPISGSFPPGRSGGNHDLGWPNGSNHA